MCTGTCTSSCALSLNTSLHISHLNRPAESAVSVEAVLFSAGAALALVEHAFALACCIEISASSWKYFAENRLAINNLQLSTTAKTTA
ncbi:unnamed protein product [Acanthoscelides obtectus]|uniref:Uncharacterized protein n=1 Tax=Acanthoscelides obtectus TaxID=200917 RepID=A0A9P0Q199_ACAOB|nr:unnamed protein product [Acanthoscelides obtectus]CAK1644585.1 hypothetical protein AOBTE_LOCUS13884 [Acanthoscelides obtectus]